MQERRRPRIHDAATRNISGHSTIAERRVERQRETDRFFAKVSVDPLVGTIIADKYLITDRIGHGGMGTIYKAKHIMLDTEVAVKVLRNGNSEEDESAQRFIQEARTASQLKHENIVQITDFGKAPGIGLYLVMEHLEGEDLSKRMTKQIEREGNMMPWNSIKGILLQACRALAEAHKLGIVHRDMKPENIMLIKHAGKDDFVKLLDFGIAKVLKSDMNLTKAGMTLGTVEYMSPEQARGERVDLRTDIYAMGVIMYELLCGYLPFEGENQMVTITMQASPDEAPLISERFPYLNIKPEVEAVVMRCLAKNREHRYRTMEELEQAIVDCDKRDTPLDEPHAEDRTIVSHRDTIEAPAMKYNRRQLPWVVGGISLVLTTAVALFVLSGSGNDKRRDPQTLETKPPVQVIARVAPAKIDEPISIAPVPIPIAEKKYRIDLNSSPQGAEVFQGAGKIGETPLSLKLTTNGNPVSFTIRRTGYADKNVDILPKKDQRFDVVLDRLPTNAPALKVESAGQKPQKPKSVPAAKRKRKEGGVEIEIDGDELF